MPQQLEVTEYDVIILGTGFVESILAGALARIGKSVLHLDSNEYYGGSWTSFNFQELLEWAQLLQGHVEESNGYSQETDFEGKKALPTDFSKVRRQAYSAIEYELYANIKQTNSTEENEEYHQPEQDTSEETIHHVSTRLSNFERETLAKLLKDSRQFNLDIAPKIMPCRGELIELLISSGVGRYLEFKALDKTYIYSDQDNFDKVPCSKEDVFTSQTVTLTDKRKLMRFLTFALDFDNSPETFEGYEEKPYDIFLREKFQIDSKLLSAVLYAIALIRTKANDVNTVQGLTYTQRYLKSLGRYGNAAFLVALYGAGSEISQGFCRISAVFGGIYMLKHSVKHLLIDESSNNFTGLIDENEECEQISRAIVIIDRYIHEESDATLTIFPPDSVGNEYPISVFQFSEGTRTCPKDKYVLYMSTKASGKSAKEDLHKALEKLVDVSNDDASLSSPLFALFYRHKFRNTTLSSLLPNNIIVTNDPDSSLDFETATIQAKQLFEKMCPNEEFLPVVPDPDDDDFSVD
ncbi:rab proteins geranylgeranyltransferase component A 1 [Rhizophagus clarus]|uniref:Rab escort protein 1 n=1 Tax=Rhizophagus clarus TaxID=94130 RepID=A0A8H3LJ59_9GLOM|nr:rab proteins geranylgeranyltransferase component A 1 [Rhizophagus clarus]